MIDPVSAALVGVPSLIKGISGLVNIGRAKRAAKRNVFPIEQANPLFQQNLAIAENAARTGLPQQQYNNSLNNIMRNQAGALTAFGRNHNRSNLASILRASNDATLNLDSQDAQARMVNQRQAMGARLNLAQEQNRVWDWNKRQRYLQNAQAISQQLRSGRENAFGALNDLSQLGMITQMNKGGGGGAGNGLSSLLDGGMSGLMTGLA